MTPLTRKAELDDPTTIEYPWQSRSDGRTEESLSATYEPRLNRSGPWSTLVLDLVVQISKSALSSASAMLISAPTLTLEGWIDLVDCAVEVRIIINFTPHQFFNDWAQNGYIYRG